MASSNNWDDIGKQIRDTVSEAIDSKDFKKLNETISQVVNEANETISKVVNTAMKDVKSGMNEAVTRGESQWKWQKQRRRENHENNVVATQGANNSALYTRRPNGLFSGIFVAVAGYSMTTIFGLMAISLFAGGIYAGGTAQTGYMVAAGIMSTIGALGLFVGVRGVGLRKRALRFRQYVELMGEHEYYAIQNLANQTGKSTKFILKDLQEMISQRMFLCGRIDDEKTHLITSNEAYEQYKLMQKAKAEKKALAQVALQEAEQMDNRVDLSEEVRDIIKEGRAYIAHVQQCNKDIPGEEFSEKLYRLEEIMKRIFAQLEKQPTNAPELHKFMNYYLPTTTKLIDAYRDLDGHSMAGENIQNTKREIEDSLDTINDAFENLLDRSFREQALDISSDISVMKAMLAQEGLTKDDLTMREK